MFRSIYKFLASLQFAIVLLSVIIVASAVGTVYETSFNADVAQKYIYGAPWFNFWLTALCVNLFCVAAIRYPWKRHQTGFVITHAGIITLLCGAMIDRIWGIEGFMHLHTTKAGANVMELHAQELRVKIGNDVALTRFKINTLWNELVAESPSKDVKVEIKNVLPVTASEVAIAAEPGGKDTKPGLNFTLQGPMMGKHDSSIFLDERDNLGPASVVFLPGMPRTAPAQAETAQLGLVFQKKPFRFTVKAGESRSEALEGLPDWKINIYGYYPNFIIDKNGPKNNETGPRNPVIYFELEGPKVNGWVPDERTVPAEIKGHDIKQDPNKVSAHREKFFIFARNGFVMNEALHGEPTGAEAMLDAPKSASSSSASVISGRNGVAFYLGDDGTLRYLIKHTPRSQNPDDEEGPPPTEKIGVVELEKAVPVAWAPGAEFIVHELVLNAQHKVVFIPHPELKAAKDQENLNQGIQCKVTVGSESKDMWVGQTEVDKTFPQYLIVGGKKVNFEFVNQTVQLPFTVSLKKFSAPTDEGSNEFAAFESLLGFKNMECAVTLKKGYVLGKTQFDATPVPVSQDYNDPIHYNKDHDIVLVGEWQGEYKREYNRYNEAEFMKKFVDFKAGGTSYSIGNDAVENVIFKNKESEQSISMNRPTTFPQSWYGPWLGVCYKFSQASHHIIPGDPEHSDPTYSGVQVLRDPGWFFKWVGCIMINFGIFTMFYLRPYFNRPKVVAPAASLAGGPDSESLKKKKKK
jgi:hypothetical protein